MPRPTQPPAPRLVAVVVTFNRLEQLKITLARLLDQGDALGGIMVFNNGSDDGTKDWLESQNDPRLSVETSSHNVGGAAGFARAMALARQTFDPDWVVLMDDDARPIAETFTAFVSQNRGHAGAWAAKVIHPDGRLCDMNRPWFNPFKSWSALASALFNGRDGFHIDDTVQRAQTVDGASFVGLFLSRAAIDRIGYPDPGLFIYGDDVLYTLALTRAGLTLNYDPALVFEHDCETVMAGAAITPLWKAYFYHRNQVFVSRAAAGRFLVWPLLFTRIAAWHWRADRYGGDKTTYLRLLRRAVRDGLRGRKTMTRADVETLISGR
ncbi:glycosyltransferase [Octadecabacter sp. G9-8]|uniref:Glycosyltransferase n=1 Tax=Octadecabacter dasysiphoniae TaxID=2909341 RepID=A0ABS9CUP2_9RHOB|nr:glycosyltransferase [Octadecabacter dasysiphoniae]MCF2870955.1 glycosyltransferase [Octadecabacter dasysiphoniae]